ncbi:MAG: chloride channel protein [Elusimicrobia bacterium]|nr:chloride channel protein [Elusimicrobiota bacterium]MDE2237081.1 chloride channel protein [Elusimicrobiota bacterium]MDE2426123.1 chloride channel protein [Elusimicrobiota bacterium]
MDDPAPVPSLQRLSSAVWRGIREDASRLFSGLPLVQQLVLTGALVGLAAGVSTFVFDWLIVLAESGTLDRLHLLPQPLRVLLLILLPALGAAGGWMMIDYFCPEAQGHGFDVVAKSIAEGEGRMRGRLNLVKSLASALTIGFGGSAGREGPSIQIGASAGSWIGQQLRLPVRDLKMVTAAGAAAGLAAAFGTPLAAVFFTMEVMLRDFATEAFPAVVIASVTAVAAARFLLGSERFLVKMTYEWQGTADFFAYACMGLAISPLGVLYERAMDLIERVSRDPRLQRWPTWTKPAIGGGLVGLIALAAPSVLGTGQSTINSALGGQLSGLHGAAASGAKIAATALTLGSGGSGGAFMPAIFIGAAAGRGWAALLHRLFAFSPHPGTFALIGMACVITSFYQAPVTAIVMALEVSQDYDILMPVMVACVIAYVVTRRKRGEAMVEH